MTFQAKHSDEEFMAVWKKYGSPTRVAQELGLNVRSVHTRRRAIEAKNKAKIDTWNDTSTRRIVIKKDEGRIDIDVENGVVIVFSDAHFWPNVRTTAFRALLALIKELKPVAVLNNGDAFDGATVSRWPDISWMDRQKKPTVIDELNAVKDRLGEIEAVWKCIWAWMLGNHDARYEAKLAAVAPEFEGVPGFTLKEHFPSWRPCWTFWINGNVRVNHFYHTGIHDTHNNLLKGQVHSVTGHTHSLKVSEWTNAMGETIYGVNTGTLANSLDQHNVDYQHGLHGNHRSGFAVLTFRNGRLLRPELVSVWDEDTFEFRGELRNADTGALI
ncbi:MAG TPA: metallophosphoesterase [Candidatus Paceibacterota bacterium]